jgi:predicted nucleotidyltransferase
MSPLIETYKDKIIEACDQYELKYLYLFGSAARNTDFCDNSDIDLLYAFNKEKIAKNDYAHNFFLFLEMLEGILKRKIDLVPGDKIKNPYFLTQVNAEKIRLYHNDIKKYLYDIFSSIEMIKSHLTNTSTLEEFEVDF